MADWRRYNTLLAGAVSGSEPVEVNVYKAGSSLFASSSDWTPAASDFKLSKDGGGQANITNTPSFVNGCLRIILTAAELSCKRLKIVIANAAITSWEIDVFTFGHANAECPWDFYAPGAFNTLTGLYGFAVTGTMQGANSTDFTLAAGDGAATNAYVGWLVLTTGGSNPGQLRRITGNSSATKVATIDAGWRANPDATTTYLVFPDWAAKVDASLQAFVSDKTGFALSSPQSFSTTGAVGAVTGNVGGNVVGSVGSVGNSGITASSFATGAITGAAINAGALNGKGDWYTGGFPANFTLLSIDGSGRVTTSNPASGGTTENIQVDFTEVRA